MKYYDEATGKVVDTTTVGGTTSPAGGVPSSSGVTTPSAGGSSSFLGGTSTGTAPGGMSQLQKLLGMYAMVKGNPTGAWSILKPEQTETAEMKNRRAAIKPAIIAVEKGLKDKYVNTGPLAAPELLSIKYLGGLGVRQSLVRQNQTFNLLKQNVVRALQGARMSDQDIELAAQYIPNVADTPATINTKLRGLREFLYAVSDRASELTE